MTDRWAACFPRSSLQAALPLRVRGGIKACNEGEVIWLTGTGTSQAIDPLLRRIPGCIRYTLVADKTIIRTSRRIPERELPAGNWSPFSAIAELHPQPAALPAGLGSSVLIRIVRSTQPAEPSAMLCPIQTWTGYAVTAPQIRLNALRNIIRWQSNWDTNCADRRHSCRIDTFFSAGAYNSGNHQCYSCRLSPPTRASHLIPTCFLLRGRLQSCVLNSTKYYQAGDARGALARILQATQVMRVQGLHLSHSSPEQ